MVGRLISLLDLLDLVVRVCVPYNLYRYNPAHWTVSNISMYPRFRTSFDSDYLAWKKHSIIIQLIMNVGVFIQTVVLLSSALEGLRWQSASPVHSSSTTPLHFINPVFVLVLWMPTKILFVTFPHDVFTLHYSCCLPLLNACVGTKNLALWELSLKMKDCQTSEERYLKLFRNFLKWSKNLKLSERGICSTYSIWAFLNSTVHTACLSYQLHGSILLIYNYMYMCPVKTSVKAVKSTPDAINTWLWAENRIRGIIWQRIE